jgi:formate dehydrogenase major subunit
MAAAEQVTPEEETMPAAAAERIQLTIDGQTVSVPKGVTLWDAARAAGIEIPVLCHHPGLDPVAVCRVCAVEVEGARVMAAACIRPAEEGMVVHTHSERVERARRMLVELLMADHPSPCAKERQTGDCELEALAREMGADGTRIGRWGTTNDQRPMTNERQEGETDTSSAVDDRSAFVVGPSSFVVPRRPIDSSSPVILVDHQACILCDRCIRACDEVQSNEVIGRAGKGYWARIAFDHDQPMGQSTCVSCGECMAACPTGALTDKPLVKPFEPLKMAAIPSVCPYCGVGCATTVHVQEAQVVRVSGRSSPGNQGRLCVKGRYGFDYALHPDRLTVPLIRREEFYPKHVLSADLQGEGDYRRRRMEEDARPDPALRQAFREATWDEALDLGARRFTEIKRESGPGALAGFGSAKCSNEDNYLFQKLIRAVFGTNNVDHCTRLCHASSVAALMETLGSGSVSDIFGHVFHADVALVIGSNTTENHPVAATFIKQAAKRGTTLIVMDPRRPPLANHAHIYVRFKPGTDVALLNGLMHVILAEGLQNDAFIAARTEGIDALRETVARYTPELVEQLTGVPRETIIEVARLYGRARAAITFWGMGISQHTTGTDNARCLISLALLTGNIGRPGTGLHPLRGQNNVQGASDVGLIPMVFTDYQPVTDKSVRAKFEKAWGVALDPNPGLTVVEIMGAALDRQIRGMFMMGENPFLSDPNINKVKKALSALDFLMVQDIFLTETAEFADVVLPATSFMEKDGSYTNTDRRVQLARKAIDPPGEARTDWQVIADLSARMGYPMRYDSTSEIFAEIAALSPSYAGITHDRMARENGVLWPCTSEEDPGTAILFSDTFPRGLGLFHPAEWAPAKELPDAEYPFVLNTGRVLQHWHTGTMTRRARALDEISPQPFVDLHPDDAAALGVEEGEPVRVRSRRGSVVVPARINRKVDPGNVFIPFHFREAAVNLLTIDALDPTAKIPEFKFCAVAIERAEVMDSDIVGRSPQEL